MTRPAKRVAVLAALACVLYLVEALTIFIDPTQWLRPYQVLPILLLGATSVWICWKEQRYWPQIVIAIFVVVIILQLEPLISATERPLHAGAASPFFSVLELRYKSAMSSLTTGQIRTGVAILNSVFISPVLALVIIGSAIRQWR